MKIRTGFVSNSSSSSFCIYGICKEEDEIKEALIDKGIATEEELKYVISDYFDSWSYCHNKKNNKLTEEDIQNEEKRFFKAEEGWECFSPYDDYYLGVSWKNIKDNETGAQFKARIEKKLKEVFGENVKCSTIEEAWRDG